MSTIAFRVDDKLKKEATELYKELGLDMTTAIKLFLTQSVKTRSIPFEIKDQTFDDLLNQKLADLILENAEAVKDIDLDKPEDRAFLFDEDFSEYEDSYHEA
ncbi:type II toxin-antitoxin system RelB/DinJ family antitoxin [Streptococcus downei]|uniref:DNA-damage-inducible protein J, putative n=1 Tax=Streptococcus downei MFe28 TaxID=764290 RepID=A0A380JCW4_STRDO|nr:type II toxin-antitoxin system RelB/DinJ family antitoxin [Streptococcus downei]EFQ57177.1 addiction module antitoxin, RelB/DinJ family [Streptococcus downei F0415]SUN35220.1 DNA-damage-inducible protein J, putative [Streptococcus downei MFe28]